MTRLMRAGTPARRDEERQYEPTRDGEEDDEAELERDEEPRERAVEQPVARAVARPVLARARTKTTKGQAKKRRRGGAPPTPDQVWARILRDRLGVTADVAKQLAAAAGSGRVIDDVERLYRNRRPAMTAADVVRVARLPGTTDALLGLLAHAASATIDELDRLAHAGRVAADLDALMAAPHNLAGADAIALAGTPGRSMAELAVLAAAVPTLPGARTAGELAAIAGLGAPTHRLTAPEAVTIANVPGRTLADLTGLLGHALNLTAAQVAALGAAGRTANDLTTLTGPPHSLPGADAITLAAVPGRSLADLGVLAAAIPALPPGRPVADLAALAGVARLTAADAVTVANVPGRTLGDLTALLGHPLNLTAAQIVAVATAGRVAPDLDALMAAPHNLAGADAIALAGTPGRSMAELGLLAAAVAAGGLGRPVSELAALAGLGAPGPPRVTAGEAVTLAHTPVTLEVLQGLLGHALNLSAAQVDAIARAGRTAGDLTILTSPAHGIAPADAVTLAAVLGRSIPDLVQLAQNRPAHRLTAEIATLAALGAPAHRFTVPEVLQIAAVQLCTIQDLVALAGHAVNLTAAELVAVAEAGRTAADLTALMTGPSAVARGDAVALASVRGRSMAYLGQLAQGVPSGRPLTELAMLAALGAPAHRLTTIADVQTVGDTPGRTVNELTALLGHRFNLSANDTAVIGAAGRTPVDLDTLSNPPYSLPQNDVVALASLRGRAMADLQQLAQQKPAHRSIDDLAALAALGGAAPYLTVADVLALAGIQNRTRADLLTLGAGVPTLLAGRTRADLVTVSDVGNPAFQLTAADAVLLTRAAGLPATFTTPKIVSLVGYVPNLTGAQIVQLVGWLHPVLNADDTLDTLQRLHAAGVGGPPIHGLMQLWNTAGENGAQIRGRLLNYWGAYQVGAARDITQPAAGGVAAGTRVLSGPMLVQQLRALLAPGAGALATLDASVAKYPTGQDPAGQSENQLWTDCALASARPRLGAGGPETAQEALVRQRLALAELMKPARFALHPGTVQQIFAHNEGQRPRAIQPPAAEDALGAALGAHTVDRHVLGGGGTINTLADLALRALGFRVSPHSPAGAFLNAGAAQNGIQTVLNNYIAAAPANWPTLRSLLAKRQPRQWTENGVNAAGRRADSTVGCPTQIWRLPPYSNPGGRGTNRLYTGDDFMLNAQNAGKWVGYPNAANPPYYLVDFGGNWVMSGGGYVAKAGFAPGAALANINNAPPNVTLRLIGADVDGGFIVHSAWPV